MSGEKDQPATQKKLRDARRDGEVAKSGDAAAAASFALGLAVIFGASGWWSEQLALLWREAMVLAFEPAESSVAPPLLALAHRCLVLLLPIAAAAAFGAVLGAVATGSVTWSFKPVSLKPDAINPAQGAARLFALDTVIEAVKILLKTALLSWLLGHTVMQLLPMLVNSTARSVDVVSSTLWAALKDVLVMAAAFMAVLAVLDVRVQTQLYLRKQRMSKDDIKREYKESEGDPEIKHKRKELAHELVMGDGRSAVASANALIMNPTHYAVALHYRPGHAALPIVAAKGRDELALTMRGWAEQAGVPIVENPPLARTLHRVPVGAPVPPETYSVVALVLKWAAAVGPNPAQLTE